MKVSAATLNRVVSANQPVKVEPVQVVLPKQEGLAGIPWIYIAGGVAALGAATWYVLKG